MADLTPIRVRGKRSATTAEKWHAGKRRKVLSRSSTPALDHGQRGRFTTSALVRAAAKNSRKRNNSNLSRLEQLPTEILQSIFEYAANVDFSLASPRIASQLASRVLYQQLSSQILHDVLNNDLEHADDASNRRVMRLMNSKFFTWPFFEAWLRMEFDRAGLQTAWQEYQDTPGHAEATDDAPHQVFSQSQWTWQRLRPSPALPPPFKLLHRPFTREKIEFLSLIMVSFTEQPEALGYMYSELVQEGLQHAVEDGVGEVIRMLFRLGSSVDTELLRNAVIDGGCKKEVVEQLIAEGRRSDGSRNGSVNFLDPALWAWADNARASNDDEKGAWLLERLKSAARDSGQSMEEHK